MSSWVENPAEGNFRFSFGDFQNPPQISSKTTSGGKMREIHFFEIFKRSLAFPRFPPRKRLENLFNIIIKYSEINFSAPKMFFRKKIIFSIGKFQSPAPSTFWAFRICDGFPKMEPISRVPSDRRRHVPHFPQTRVVLILLELALTKIWSHSENVLLREIFDLDFVMISDFDPDNYNSMLYKGNPRNFGIFEALSESGSFHRGTAPIFPKFYRLLSY